MKQDEALNSNQQSPYEDDGRVAIEDGHPRPAAGLSAWMRGLIWIAAIGLLFAAAATIISAATSPPTTGVPVGHILYMDTDQPSEKTAMLRGLYMAAPGGKESLVIHELEPQDVDAGAREWINEPAASPDGMHVAFVRQLITILDEKQADDYQVCVADLTGSMPAQARKICDLSADHIDAVTGLAWTPDSRNVCFLDGDVEHTIPIDGIEAGRTRTLPTPAPPQAANGVSSQSIVAVLPDLNAVYTDVRGGLHWGPNEQSFVDQYVISSQLPSRAAAAAVTGDGRRLAYVPQSEASPTLHVVDVVRFSGTTALNRGKASAYRTWYGWSLFGGRRITSLRWSPDGRYLGFTVSKPPVSENEMYYMDMRTHKTYKLPFRTGPASWDWTH